MGSAKYQLIFLLHIHFSISISTLLHHLSSVAIRFLYSRIRFFNCINVLHRSGENGKLDLILLISLRFFLQSFLFKAKIEVGCFFLFYTFSDIVRARGELRICLLQKLDVNKNSSLITRISLVFGSFDESRNESI